MPHITHPIRPDIGMDYPNINGGLNNPAKQIATDDPSAVDESDQRPNYQSLHINVRDDYDNQFHNHKFTSSSIEGLNQENSENMSIYLKRKQVRNCPDLVAIHNAAHQPGGSGETSSTSNQNQQQQPNKKHPNEQPTPPSQMAVL